MKYSKPALDIEDQLAKLLSKGLLVSDATKAKDCLACIGYYRLSAYAHPFKNPPDRRQFKSGTTFEQILNLYEFDRQLRLLVNDAVERCEIAIRSQIVNSTSMKLGSHWFEDQRNFRPGYRLTDLHRRMEVAVGIRLDRATGEKTYPKRHSETFISHYYTKYGDPELPPIWMTAEMLSFGVLSRLYAELTDFPLKKEIAARFGVHPTVFEQWLQSISYLRNLCAHHSRLWNRVFSIPPKVAKKHANLISVPDKFHAFAVVLFELLKSIKGGNDWAARLYDLLSGNLAIDPSAMGFPVGWNLDPFWNLSAGPTTQ